MQQSTDPYQVEMANYPNQMHQQQADPIIHPVVPQDNYLINSYQNGNNEVNSTRLKQIFQIIGITLIFGINQIHRFSSIYLSEVDTEWWGSSFTQAKFRMFHDDKATIQEYYDWKEEKWRFIFTYLFFGLNLSMGFKEYYMAEALSIVEFYALYTFFILNNQMSHFQCNHQNFHLQ